MLYTHAISNHCVKETSVRKVGYARSTYRKAREFQLGIEELSATLPLGVARAYLETGITLDDYVSSDYTRVEALQELRKSAIQGEMRYAQAQVTGYGEDDPALVQRVAECEGCSTEKIEVLLEKAKAGELTAEDLFGPRVLSGDDIRFGFGPDALELAPSLGVYELVMWATLGELECLGEQQITL